MNKKTWDNLSHDIKPPFSVPLVPPRPLGPVMNSSFDAQIADLRNDGATVRLLTPEEVIQWATETHYQQAQSDWVTTQETKGIKGAGTVMNQVNVLMDETMKQKTR